jgi:UDP-apiose/xylose synthase
MKILMLGGGGFLGYHIVSQLKDAGTDIMVVDLDPSRLDELAPHPQIHIKKKSTNEVDIAGLTKDADVVMSLAAICNPSRYNTEQVATIRSNFIDQLPVIEACALNSTWLVHFSTCEVYGKRNHSWPQMKVQGGMEGDMILGPVQATRWTYACAKQLTERYILAQHQAKGLPYTIIRPFNVVGPRMDYLPMTENLAGKPRVMACFVDALLQQQRLKVVGDGQQRRCWCHVDDFSKAIASVLERPAAAKNQIFNVGNPDNDVTILQLAEMMINQWERLTEEVCPGIEHVSPADFYGDGYDDVDARVPVQEDTEKRLRWNPKKMMPSIVRDTLDYYRGRWKR